MLIARVRARIVPVVASVLIGCTGIGSTTAESWATKDPCKLLTKEEIAKVFGAPVSEGKKGLRTAEQSQCEYSVKAAGEWPDGNEEEEGGRPQGTLVVIVVFVGAKTAYNDLESKKAINGYEPIAEFPNALYTAVPSIVDVLVGDVLLGVQGVFMPEELVPVPAHLWKVRSELVELAKLAVERL
jgi:hypothetical protein